MKKKKDLLDYKYLKPILSVVVIIILLIPFLLFKNGNKKVSDADEKKVFAHTDAEIVKEEEFDNLKVSNITMITDNGYTTFTADVTNVGTEPTDFENVNIDLKDENGDTVIVLLGNIGKDLKPNETRVITASAKGEFKNVSSKSITVFRS